MTARLGTLEGRARSAAAFNRMVKLDAVGAMGLEYSFIAEPGECATLATRYEILDVAGLRATADLEQTLPIRLTPMTATCWVRPLSRVKLGIGWSRGVARDAEQ